MRTCLGPGLYTKGTNASKNICLMFVYVSCTFVSGLTLLFWDNLWFDGLLLGKKIGDRLNIVFSPDVILCF